MTLKEIVTLTDPAILEYAIAGTLYYTIDSPKAKITFPVDMNDKDDVGTTTFCRTYKPITLMRYIRKAIDNGTIIISSKPVIYDYSVTTMTEVIMRVYQEYQPELEGRNDEEAKKLGLSKAIIADEIKDLLEDTYLDSDVTGVDILSIKSEVTDLSVEEHEF